MLKNELNRNENNYLQINGAKSNINIYENV